MSGAAPAGGLIGRASCGGRGEILANWSSDVCSSDLPAPTAKKRPPQLDSPMVKRGMKYVSRAQVWCYRRTNGRIGGKWRVGSAFRHPVAVLLLDHVGRRSGRRFTTPLLYLEDGPDLVVVASQGGRADHPQWYRNLCATPDTQVQVGAELRLVR